MAWTTPPTYVTGQLMTATIANQQWRDNENAILGGLAGVGFTLIDLLGAAAPAVSAAGHIKIAYDSVADALVVSKNTAAFAPIGAGDSANSIVATEMLA